MPTYKIPVKIEYAQGGAPGVNVWHARANNEETDFADVLQALDTFYNDIKNLMKNTTRVTVGTGMIRDPYGSPTYMDDDPTVITGNGSAAAMSPLLCYCVNWKTASATRSGRGRTFIGPLTIDNNDVDGTPVAGLLTVVRNAATTLANASQATNGWALGVYSHKDRLLRDFTGASVNDKFAYLSSRRD